MKYLKEKGFITPGVVHIDLDHNRTFLPAWHQDKNHPKDHSTVDATQVEAGLIAQLAGVACCSQGISFVNDGTFRNQAWNLSFIRRIMRVAHHGKVRIGIILIDTKKEVCLKRARARAESSGRPVRREFVSEVNKKARENAYYTKDF